MNTVQESTARSDTRRCVSANRPDFAIEARPTTYEPISCIVPGHVHTDGYGCTENCHHLLNQRLRLATLPPPPAPLTVKVFDEAGALVDGFDVPVDGYAVVTNGKCKVDNDHRLVSAGVHTLTITGVAPDAAVIR